MKAQPKLVILEKQYEHGSVQFVGDLHGQRTGLLTIGGKLRRNAPWHLKAQLRYWQALQKQRTREGLPPLTEDEMMIVP